MCFLLLSYRGWKILIDYTQPRVILQAPPPPPRNGGIFGASVSYTGAAARWWRARFVLITGNQRYARGSWDARAKKAFLSVRKRNVRSEIRTRVSCRRRPTWRCCLLLLLSHAYRGKTPIDYTAQGNNPCSIIWYEYMVAMCSLRTRSKSVSWAQKKNMIPGKRQDETTENCDHE